ncbi:TetR/AcrR family transcriptional regulator C-terminal domain-containing protein [Nonomuraea sp. NPDC005983]|uniref:TetR/AcrR family transcriptional regulator C-terminal domain-containing protein n=1 Tax=Nonomuraea sp. NPDC005983 TaxID=3155595 RepID=UPI0033A0B1AE
MQVFATRPVRSPAAIDTGVKMLTKLHADGIPPAHALRIARCLREFIIGHALAIAMTKPGAERRSRKPRPDSPDYNLLAEAADTTTLDDHFEPGLTAILHGFQHSAD